MENIIEISTTRNLCQIRLNLRPNDLVQIMGAFSQITQIVQENLRRADMDSIASYRRGRSALFMSGIAVFRLARRMGKRIEEIADIAARSMGISRECAIARGYRARRHVKYRFRRWRDNAIRRLASEGVALTTLATRFNLSKGRVSQIVSQQKG